MLKLQPNSPEAKEAPSNAPASSGWAWVAALVIPAYPTEALPGQDFPPPARTGGANMTGPKPHELNGNHIAENLGVKNGHIGNVVVLDTFATTFVDGPNGERYYEPHGRGVSAALLKYGVRIDKAYDVGSKESEGMIDPLAAAEALDHIANKAMLKEGVKPSAINLSFGSSLSYEQLNFLVRKHFPDESVRITAENVRENVDIAAKTIRKEAAEDPDCELAYEVRQSRAVSRVISQGIPVVMSAGNTSEFDPRSTSHINPLTILNPDMIVVAGYGKDGKLDPGSYHNTLVDTYRQFSENIKFPELKETVERQGTSLSAPLACLEVSLLVKGGYDVKQINDILATRTYNQIAFHDVVGQTISIKGELNMSVGNHKERLDWLSKQNGLPHRKDPDSVIALACLRSLTGRETEQAISTCAKISLTLDKQSVSIKEAVDLMIIAGKLPEEHSAKAFERLTEAQRKGERLSVEACRLLLLGK